MIDLAEIRARSRIEEVVQEKFPLKKSGSHLIGMEHDSLVVNPRTGWYHWNSRDEHGDVFDFVIRHALPGVAVTAGMLGSFWKPCVIWPNGQGCRWPAARR